MSKHKHLINLIALSDCLLCIMQLTYVCKSRIQHAFHPRKVLSRLLRGRQERHNQVS